jgi:hypothetical protein
MYIHDIGNNSTIVVQNVHNCNKYVPIFFTTAAEIGHSFGCDVNDLRGKYYL